MKFTISNKKGQAKQIEVEDDKAVMGKKIGDKIDGSLIGLEGYEFEVKGGSDSAGFPMRRDVKGSERKRILTVSGVGIKAKRRGMLQRKTVSGNTISYSTAQVNLYVTKEGKEDLFAEAKEEAEGEAPAEDKKEEAKADEKEEKKEEEKKAEAKEDKAEEKKETPKEETKEEKKEEKNE